MTHAHTIAHKAATDPDFRAALLADPQAAVTRWDLQVSAEELAVLSEVAHLLALPSQDLLSHLLGSTVDPEQQWFAWPSAEKCAEA